MRKHTYSYTITCNLHNHTQNTCVHTHALTCNTHTHKYIRTHKHIQAAADANHRLWEGAPDDDDGLEGNDDLAARLANLDLGSGFF